MQIPDSTICSLLNQGEEKGMEYLFTRYYKPLVLWAASFLNNIPQSEDLVQDFFIRLWEKRTQTSLQATTFKSFLYTSVRNLAFDRMENKLGISIATVNTLLVNALKKIRQAYPDITQNIILFLLLSDKKKIKNQKHKRLNSNSL